MKNTILGLTLLLIFSCKNGNSNEEKNEDDDIEALIDINKNFDLCEDLIIQIIESSKENQEEKEGLLEFIKERGGTSFGYMLESYPNLNNQNAGNSEYYEFNFHASYPERMGVISRYRFHPIKLTLERYDVVENEYFKIEFDKALLNKLNDDCR